MDWYESSPEKLNLSWKEQNKTIWGGFDYASEPSGQFGPSNSSVQQNRSTLNRRLKNTKGNSLTDYFVASFKIKRKDIRLHMMNTNTMNLNIDSGMA